MFSGQTFHTTGAISSCTFHFFLMAGPSGTGPGCSLSSALSSVIVLSSSEGSHDGEDKNLKSQGHSFIKHFSLHRASLLGDDSSEANRDPELPS